MFNNGGMVAPQPQPVGILGSSPSLIDTVIDTVVNESSSSDMGAGSLSMAQGGVARFANGGQMMQARPNQMAPDALTVDRMPAGIKVDGSQFIPMDTSILEILTETPRKKYERIFNAEIDPDSIKNPLPPGKASRFDNMMFGIANQLKSAGSKIGDAADFAFASGDSKRSMEQISAINTMIRRRPDLADTIKDYGKKILEAYPERSGNDLELDISRQLSRSLEGVEGYKEDSVESKAGMGAVGDGGAQAYLDEQRSIEDDKFRQGFLGEEYIAGMGAVGNGGPLQNQDAGVVDPSPQSVMGAVGPGVADSGPSSKVPDTSTDAGPQGSQIPLEIMAEISETKPGQKPPSPTAVSEEDSKTIQQIKDAAENNDPEKVKKGMEDYIAEFKAAMPEYEGKTEYESGMDIVKMGMAVASGQSPNAIENISKGVLATIDNFTSDDKEKRKYKQQIGLSGAKYALQKLAKDDENALSLAKENRGFKRFIVKTPFTEGGVDYKVGSIYQTTIGDMREDNFSSVLPNLTTEGIYKQIIDDKAATAALIQKNLAPKMLDQGKGSAQGKEYIKSFKDYNATLKNLKTSSTMLTMIDSSIKINAEGKVTGLTNLGNRAIAKLRASVGMSQELTKLKALKTSEDAGVDSLRFSDQQQVIANMMLREILGEGSKNVSNIDRQLASEIVGLMTDLRAVTMPPALLNDRLQRIRVQVTNGVKENMNNLRGTEVRWENYVNAASRKLSPEFARVKREAMGDIVNPQSKAANRRLKESDPFAAPVSKRAPLLFKDFFDMSTMKQTKKITR